MNTEAAYERINRETVGLPERWREVLITALADSDCSSEAELFLQSALSVHKTFPTNLEPAEAILAGDAFVPLAVQAMLDNNISLDDIDEHLRLMARKLNKSGAV
jgi:hypothetical protein